MLEDLDSHRDIVRITDSLLRQADAYDRYPTPIADLVEAAGLSEAPQTFLAEASIEKAPSHLREALRRLRGKVSAALDRRAREIHINPRLDHDGQKAFKRLHETTHHILPWQTIRGASEGFADDEFTLSPATQILFEREANQGAAELLFQRGRFAEIAAEYAVGLGAVIELATKFGASRHATFRRYVETHLRVLAGVVLGRSPITDDPLSFRRHEAVCSYGWLERFGDPSSWPTVLYAQPYTFLSEARATRGLRPPAGQWICPDLNNSPITLRVEAMTNGYRTFVLIWLPQREILRRRPVMTVAA